MHHGASATASGLQACAPWLTPCRNTEKQEQGSMLCAQHALNALLQGSYYDPSQLAGESGLPALLPVQALSSYCLHLRLT
jgi:hypothetical protein